MLERVDRLVADCVDVVIDCGPKLLTAGLVLTVDMARSGALSLLI